MWTVPLVFLGCALMSYALLPTETVLNLSELPVNSTNLSILFTVLSVVTFIRDFNESRKGTRPLETPDSPVAPPASNQSPRARTMRGVIIRGYGEDSVTVSGEVPRPDLTYVDEVLVRVRAASVNPMDVQISAGRGRELCNSMRSMRGTPAGNGKEFPIILGRDFSGVVERVGSKVTKVKAGDEVWAAIPFYCRGGGMGDYIVVTETDISKKPQGITHQEAATLPSVACTVWCSLVRTAVIGSKRTKEQRVLITGGTGGVGTFAVQLVKAWGGHVTASCRDGNGAKLLKSLRADDVVNVSEIDLESSLIDKPKFDVIIDTVGPPVRETCFKLCVKNGYFVSFVTPVLDDAEKYGVMVGSFMTNVSKMKLAWLKGCSFSWSLNLPDGKILDRVAKYVESKKIRPVVDQIYRVDEAQMAFRHVAEGHTRGKTVITFDAGRQ